MHFKHEAKPAKLDTTKSAKILWLIRVPVAFSMSNMMSPVEESRAIRIARAALVRYGAWSVLVKLKSFGTLR